MGTLSLSLLLTIDFSRQRAIESPAAVHVLPRLPLRDLPHGTNVVPGDGLSLSGVEPNGNPKFLHHLHLILIHHNIAILIALFFDNGVLLRLLILRNGVILVLVLVLVLFLGYDVVLVALPGRRGGAGAGAMGAVAMTVSIIR